MQKICPDLEIGRCIAGLRRERGLTREQVVDELNLMGLRINPGVYTKLETNRNSIYVSEIVALTIIFNCDFNAFFAGLTSENSD